MRVKHDWRNQANSALRFSRMAGFDEAWAAVDHPKDGEPVSPELQPLLRGVYSEVLAATRYVLPAGELRGHPSTRSTSYPTRQLHR